MRRSGNALVVAYVCLGKHCYDGAYEQSPLGGAMQSPWYIARDGKQVGPISQAEFNALLQSAQLMPTDYVWREGFADWRCATEFFSGISKVAQPVRGLHRRRKKIRQGR